MKMKIQRKWNFQRKKYIPIMISLLDIKSLSDPLLVLSFLLKIFDIIDYTSKQIPKSGK
jgi:hypothetical protein